MARFLVSTFLIVFACGFAPAKSFAQAVCSSLFAVTKPLRAADTIQARNNWIKQNSFHGLSEEPERMRDKVWYSLKKLTAVGVNAHVMHVVQGRGFSNELEISTEGPSRLNIVAAALKRNYGTRLTFDPRILRRNSAQAATSADYDRIWISKTVAYTGEIDDALMHEITHVAMGSRETLGIPDLLNGSYRATWTLDRILKWRTPLPENYPTKISLEELWTYYKGFLLLIRGGKQLIADGTYSEKEISGMLRESGKDLMPLLFDIRHLLQLEKFELDGEGPNGSPGRYKIDYDDETGQTTIQILAEGFESQHIIPGQIVNAHAPWILRIHDSDLPYLAEKKFRRRLEKQADFFDTEEGKKVLEKAARDYFDRLLDEADDIIRYLRTQAAERPRSFVNSNAISSSAATSSTAPSSAAARGIP